MMAASPEPEWAILKTEPQLFNGYVAMTQQDATRVLNDGKITLNGHTYTAFKKTADDAVAALLTSRAGTHVALLATKVLVLEIGLTNAQLGDAVMNGRIFKHERWDQFGRPGWNFYGDFPLTDVDARNFTVREAPNTSDHMYIPVLQKLDDRYGSRWLTRHLFRTPTTLFRLLASELPTFKNSPIVDILERTLIREMADWAPLRIGDA